MSREKPERIELPMPPMGGKAWLLERKGTFILETGPGTIRTIACTHAGSGQIQVFDGIPDERGFFPDEDMEIPSAYTVDELTALREGAPVNDALAEKMEAMKRYATRNGRPFYHANPIVMGSWMMDGGFHHGLTIIVSGEHATVNPFATVVWAKFVQRNRT